MPTKKKSLREAILDAAATLIEDHPEIPLTLDAVAKKAGVSKGGLLHHFRSKEALYEALVARLVAVFEVEQHESSRRVGAHGSGDLTQEIEEILSYVDRSFQKQGRPTSSARILFAAAAYQPALLAPIRSYVAQRAKLILKTSKNPRAVLGLILLADGLWALDALGVPPFSGKLREQMRKATRQWARQLMNTNADDDVDAGS